MARFKTWVTMGISASQDQDIESSWRRYTAKEWAYLFHDLRNLEELTTTIFKNKVVEQMESLGGTDIRELIEISFNECADWFSSLRDLIGVMICNSLIETCLNELRAGIKAVPSQHR